MSTDETTSTQSYVVDTNVIIHDSEFYQKIPGNFTLPSSVLKELDHLKNREKGARDFIHFLDQKEFGTGDGIECEGSRIEVRTVEATGDDGVMEAIETDDVLLTRDKYLRVRARIEGEEVQKYDAQNILEQEIGEFYISQGNADGIFGGEGVDLGADLKTNEPVFLHSHKRENILARKHEDGFVRKAHTTMLQNIKPRNARQHFALDILMDDDVDLVTLSGKAGTGKTLLSLLAGISKLSGGRYDQVLVFRPMVQIGQDMGYLPGTIEEKIEPWIRPIEENLEFIMRRANLQFASTSDGLQQMGHVSMEPMQHIRGRTIENKFILIDEAQNLTDHQIKSALTRAGKGSKVVLTGDPYQVDHPKLSTNSNGLCTVVEKMRNSDIFGRVHLTEGERSRLAEEAAQKL